jgi:hypothetical protein
MSIEATVVLIWLSGIFLLYVPCLIYAGMNVGLGRDWRSSKVVASPFLLTVWLVTRQSRRLQRRIEREAELESVLDEARKLVGASSD